MHQHYAGSSFKDEAMHRFADLRKGVGPHSEEAIVDMIATLGDGILET